VLAPPKEISFVCEKSKRGVEEFLKLPFFDQILGKTKLIF
jgi:hypothetical protein